LANQKLGSIQRLQTSAKADYAMHQLTMIDSICIC